MNKVKEDTCISCHFILTYSTGTLFVSVQNLRLFDTATENSLVDKGNLVLIIFLNTSKIVQHQNLNTWNKLKSALGKLQ